VIAITHRRLLIAVAVLPVTLAAGEYTFACKLGAHDLLGMKGALIVTGC
jgi:plastocyanin